MTEGNLRLAISQLAEFRRIVAGDHVNYRQSEALFTEINLCIFAVGAAKKRGAAPEKTESQETERQALSRVILDEGEITPAGVHAIRRLVGALQWTPETERFALAMCLMLQAHVDTQLGTGRGESQAESAAPAENWTPGLCARRGCLHIQSVHGLEGCAVHGCLCTGWIGSDGVKCKCGHILHPHGKCMTCHCTRTEAKR